MKQTIILILLSFVFNFAFASREDISDTTKPQSKLKLSFDLQLNSIFSISRNNTSNIYFGDSFLSYDLNSNKLFGMMTGGGMMLEYKKWNLGIHSSYAKTNISYDIYFRDDLDVFKKYLVKYHTHSFNLSLQIGRIFSITKANVKIETGVGLAKIFSVPSKQDDYYISFEYPYEIEHYSILVQSNNSLNLGSLGSLVYLKINKVFQFGEIGLNMTYLNDFFRRSRIDFYTKNHFLMTSATLVPQGLFSIGISFKKYLIQ